MRKRITMTGRTGILILLLLLIPGYGACVNQGADGNLVGTVVWEETDDPVPNPVLMVALVGNPPTVPDLVVDGDDLGRFEITLPAGNYSIQVSTGADGPFYARPDPVLVSSGFTSVILVKLPDGY